MKSLALSIAIAVALLATPLLFAGPEPLPSGKESKAVVQPAPPPECNWTGFYVGGQVGYAWSGDWSFKELNETDLPLEFDPDGFIYGGQVGFNWQFGRMFVVGVEGTFSGLDFDDHDRTDEGGEETAASFEVDWMATAAARVGLSFWRDHMLVYGRGGAAWTEWDFNTREVGASEHFHVGDTDVMGMVGFGVEYAFNCHWSVRVEYNHLFGDDDDDVTGLENDSGTIEKRDWHAKKGDWDMVQAGLNFRF